MTLVFDDGALRDDPQNARLEVDALVALMEGTDTRVYKAEEYLLRYVF